MNTEKKYTVGKKQQLIDLNGDHVNFRLQFMVSSEDKNEYELIVASQTDLDKGDEFNFKKVQGSISGNITADKGIYQNYFLVIRCLEKDVVITVKTHLEEIELPPADPPLEEKNEDKTDNSMMKKIIWILGGLVVLYLLYIYLLPFLKKTKKDKTSLKFEITPVKIETPKVEIPTPTATPVKIETPTVETPVSESMSSGVSSVSSSNISTPVSANADLLTRLQNFRRQ